MFINSIQLILLNLNILIQQQWHPTLSTYLPFIPISIATIFTVQDTHLTRLISESNNQFNVCIKSLRLCSNAHHDGNTNYTMEPQSLLFGQN